MLFNMLINKDNVEAYLLDYLEGNLDPADERALETFLKAHPECAGLLDEETLPKLVPDKSVVYANKEALKHPEERANIFYMRPTTFRLAAAAAILAVIVSIALPFFRGDQKSNPTGMRAHANIPEVTIDTTKVGPQVDQSNPSEPQKLPSKEDKRPAPGKRQVVPPASPVAPPNDYVAVTRDPVPDLLPSKHIDRLELDHFVSEELQMKHNLMAATGPIVTNNPNWGEEKSQRKWYSGILNSEVARNFLPEAVQESLPDQEEKTNHSQSQRNLILELPPAGKRLIDALFKSEE